ncbi:MAG: GNAT family N-acetyltransferase [Bacteroidetes bacterium]|nr:GNAT family N-acetyltransferase [Bacteroidota bacterium]
MEIRNLNGVSFETIYQTFLEAFKDYAVNVNYMDAVKLQNRAIKNGYDPACSAGAFENERLVGFTLVGIDRQYIQPSAFDIMTGIIGEQRGRGLAGKMFKQIRSALIKIGIKQFYLEVLQENMAAVKAYQKEGFRIERDFNCYSLKTSDFNPAYKLKIPLQLKVVAKKQVTDFETFADWQPSWENSFTSIQRIPDALTIIAATYSIKKVGIIIYYPALKWIMNLLVDPIYRNMGVGSALIEKLLQSIGDDTIEIRYLNIPADDYALNEFLSESGFHLFTKQYEMILSLA